ncbi:peptidylprolyl isomerase [Serinibacter arcticus]|uniref:peptidylprolyl isomerase n=1 Tax=Serinibacter arcticus TaxID=1655435 RepID=A0A2U1ZS95_9MICO|nr:FKBP-type peptidyl-prolyl cis-trans isomerase [Serinibacter arcticus]PWD49859.1 peptidylprolyl isomerase [Serinibacter arcticus]
MRRRLIAVPSALLVAALVLGACSSDPDDGGTESGSPTSSESETTPTEVESVENVVAGSTAGFTASGEFGEKPTLEFTETDPPEGLQAETVTEGDGEEVAAGDYVVAHYLGQIWGTETVFDNSYDRGAPTGFSLNQVIQGWSTGLVGQKVGSRVLLTIPSFLGYAEGQGDIKPGDTIVFVVDIAGIIPADGTGQADAAPTDAEVPVTITGDLGSAVTGVTLTEGAGEPTEATTTVIATGTGPEIAEGDTAGLQYYVTSWDGAQVQSTWPPEGVGAQTATIGQGTPFDQLVGVPVGSRVLLQVPADAASGSPAVAVVVDVVATVPA